MTSDCFATQMNRLCGISPVVMQMAVSDPFIRDVETSVATGLIVSGLAGVNSMPGRGFVGDIFTQFDEPGYDPYSGLEDLHTPPAPYSMEPFGPTGLNTLRIDTSTYPQGTTPLSTNVNVSNFQLGVLLVAAIFIIPAMFKK